MKKIISKLFPRWAKKQLKLAYYWASFLPDYLNWLKFDILYSPIFPNERSRLADLLIKGHVLEKGITMPGRRLGFGYDRVRGLIRSTDNFIKNYSENHIEVQSALKDLEQYYQLHVSEKFNLPTDIEEGITTLLKYKHSDTAECFECTAEEFFRQTADFAEFARQRHSVRWYSEEKIDNELLKKAIELAQTAPSACNRQSTKVYVVETPEKKEKILNIQHGNRGFGFMADKILLLTTDMKLWDCNFRTSGFLDTGIFTMNLLYSLHYYKICACTLNAQLNRKQRKELRNIVGFSESEIPVVFMVVGKAPNHFMIAGSQRVNVEEVFTFV